MMVFRNCPGELFLGESLVIARIAEEFAIKRSVFGVGAWAQAATAVASPRLRPETSAIASQIAVLSIPCHYLCSIAAGLFGNYSQPVRQSSPKNEVLSAVEFIAAQKGQVRAVFKDNMAGMNGLDRARRAGSIAVEVQSLQSDSRPPQDAL
jgi:hypothetical protein